MQRWVSRKFLNVTFLLLVFSTSCNSLVAQLGASEQSNNFLDVKLVSFNILPAEPGYIFLDFQLLIENHSRDIWANFPRSLVFKNYISTSEGYEYDREFQYSVDQSIMDIREHGFRGEILGQYDGIDKTVDPSLPLLPPGFQTLVTRERWKVSEFITDPILHITLEANNKKMYYELPLNDNNLAPYPHTPFVGNISWSEYKSKYSSTVNALDKGESRNFDFGSLNFLGFEKGPQGHLENYLIFQMEITNASKGYPLSFHSDLDGYLVDGSVGFAGYTSHPIRDQLGYQIEAGPGQTVLAGWGFLIDEYKGLPDLHESDNWQVEYPFDYDLAQKPICMIAEVLEWSREDVGRLIPTAINLVACEP